LDIRALYPFVSSLSPYIARLGISFVFFLILIFYKIFLLEIVNGKGAIFSATELECHLTLYIAGQQQD